MKRPPLKNKGVLYAKYVLKRESTFEMAVFKIMILRGL